MTSYIGINELAKTESLRDRITVGIVQVAGQILNQEKPDDMADGEYEKRIDYARNAIRDPQGLASAFVWPVLSNAEIAQNGLESTDSDIEYQINQVWSIMAGVTAADKIVVMVPPTSS